MSNVLIAIIGVILFIGLALAGAFFLGPRFSTADSSSKAAALVAQAQQIAAANASYEANTGETIGASRNGTGVGFLSGYMKNPVGTWNTFTYAPGTVVYSYLGSPSDKTSKICEAIQRHTGQIQSNDPPLLTVIDLSIAETRWPLGCVLHSGGQYAVYTKL